MERLPYALLDVCVNHRARFNIKIPPAEADCVNKACKTGCPINRMPSALTQKEMKDIELEVFREEATRLRNEKIGREGE